MQPSAARHCRHCLHIPPPFFTAYFTNGLKLLLVGVDETTQTKVQKYLPQPYYQIYKYDRPEDALRYLQQEGKNTYDLVFIDVESGGKDGYPLIQEVQRSCSNIAHVEICRNETSSDEILRAYKGGACSVLWKPVNEVKDEIVNLWRHVCRMKEQLKASETHLSNNNNVMPETHLSNNNNVMPETHLSDVEHMRKHETSETYLNNSDYVYHGDYIQQNGSVPLLLQNQNQGCSSLGATDEDEFLNYGMESPPRKRRVVWTGRLQECFLEAVDELGGPDKAVPKRILEKIQEKMHAPELTRENVGSHLQKYRQQMTKDRELHDNHSLANLPMQTQIQPSEQNLNNFVRVATLSTVPSSSLVGNGSNNGNNNLSSIIEELNLTSSDSSRIPASGTYVTTTRVNPQVRNAFASRMLQRRQIGVAVHQNQNSTMYHQLDRYVRGPNNEGIQAMGTSFASNTSAQQLDPNLASGSSSHVSTNYNGFINQNPALGTSLGTTMQEFSNMMQTPPNPTSSMQQVLQNPSSGSGIINQNPSSGSGMINQNEVDEYFLPPK